MYALLQRRARNDLLLASGWLVVIPCELNRKVKWVLFCSSLSLSSAAPIVLFENVERLE